MPALTSLPFLLTQLLVPMCPSSVCPCTLATWVCRICTVALLVAAGEQWAAGKMLSNRQKCFLLAGAGAHTHTHTQQTGRWVHPPPHILPSVLIRLADTSLKGSQCPPWINYLCATLLPHVTPCRCPLSCNSKIRREQLKSRALKSPRSFRLSTTWSILQSGDSHWKETVRSETQVKWWRWSRQCAWRSAEDSLWGRDLGQVGGRWQAGADLET